MLNELQIKKLFKKELEEYIKSLTSNGIYFMKYEAACRAYMNVLNDEEMLYKYKWLGIENARELLKELEEYIEENDKISKAIKNILKEAGYKMSRAGGGTVSFKPFDDEYKLYIYEYAVSEEGDIIYIIDDDHNVAFRKNIKDYL